MSGTGRIETTNRVTMKVDGAVFSMFTKVEIARDLQNISGVFTLECVDQARLRDAAAALAYGDPDAAPLDAGKPVRIEIDGEPVLIGWIDRMHLFWNGDRIHCRIDGRDRTGDLADCAAFPNGPGEFRGADLLNVMRQMCEPFGIPVKADVDLGAPFERLSLHPHETGLAFAEKATRQRSVLLTSDGVGGLLLTRGGKDRAPAALTMGQNIADMEFDRDWTRRFSDYFVLGQTARRRGGAPAVDPESVPDTDIPDAGPGVGTEEEAASIVMSGHVTDPEIARWRPVVATTRTQSGMATAAEQADWMLRVAKGQSEGLRISVQDWRDGAEAALWRPNQVVAVVEPYSGTSKDMLIAGVRFSFTEDGPRTQMRVVGLTAFDRTNEAERQRGRKGAHTPRSAGNTPLRMK